MWVENTKRLFVPWEAEVNCLVVVAHPDDEAIWMGGVILGHARWRWRVMSLCRADDPDRKPRFDRAACEFGAEASISDLDDSPQLAPLSPDLIEIKNRLSDVMGSYDLIFTHGPDGEYTRHPRHEQVHRAVCEMVEDGQLTGDLLFFAYQDCGGTCWPQPAADAQVRIELPEEIFAHKRRVIRDIYGFGPGSREYEAAGQIETFRLMGTGEKVSRLQTELETEKLIARDKRCVY